MSHVVILDNYDSFTFNLAQAFAVLGCRVSVHRNDVLTLEELVGINPGHLVISPGPGGPRGTGLCARALQHFRGRLPILGVCLGHQILAECLDLEVGPAEAPVHGKAWPIHHDGTGLFRGLPGPVSAARYHSLVVKGAPGRPELRVPAWTDQGEIMGLTVAGECTWGVQFHPESYLTPDGPQLLANFLDGAVCSEFSPVWSRAHHAL